MGTMMNNTVISKAGTSRMNEKSKSALDRCKVLLFILLLPREPENRLPQHITYLLLGNLNTCRVLELLDGSSNIHLANRHCLGKGTQFEIEIADPGDERLNLHPAGCR